MFAVPGWSISPEKLKAQTASKTAVPTADTKSNTKEDGEKKSKKRKRGNGKHVEVTGENLGDLWAKHIEAKTLGSRTVNGESSDGPRKRKKKHATEGSEQALEATTDGAAEGVNGTNPADHGQSRSGNEGEEKIGPREKKKDKRQTADVLEEEVVNGGGGPRKKNKRERARDKYEAKAKAALANASKTGLEANEKSDLEKHPHLEKQELRSADDALGGGRPQFSGESPEAVPGGGLKDEVKAKFERRKAKVERKKAARALKQANGSLPPSRPPAGPDSSMNSLKKDTSSTAHPSNPEVTNTAANANDQTKPVSVPQSKPSPPPKTSSSTLPPQPPQQKLTPLQQKMTAKLTSARFRHLNETLYTTPSHSALALFTTTPSAYTAYHAGFRAQVAVWPSNPIQGFIEDVKSRGGLRRDRGSQAKAWRAQLGKGKKGKGKGKGKGSGPDDGNVDGDVADSTFTINADPLPRSTKATCSIADLGCGDAALAVALLPLASPQQLNLRIQSFDLAQGEGPNAKLVTVADVTDLKGVGVGDGSVDVAVCCLALMGTNWVGVVEECGRVVRVGGEVWVAEIRSRFVRRGEAERGRKKVEWSVGEKKKKGKKGGKKRGDEDEEVGGEEEARAAVMEELDGGGKGDETDVSGFVAVWKKRGFALKGEPDLGNKMFVKMRFVSEGKVGAGGEGGFMTSRAKMASVGGKKFIEKAEEGEGEMDEQDEGRVLKPCVYKTR